MAVIKVKLLVLDKNMNTAEIELESWQFRSLGITPDIVKKHESKSSLNKCVTEFVKNSGNS